MASCSNEDESQFFDVHDDIAAFSNLGSDCPECGDSHSGEDICNWASSTYQFGFWVQNPLSVEERRSNFLNWLGLSANRGSCGDGLIGSSVYDADFDRVTSCNGAVLSSSSECSFSSSRSAVSSWSGHGSGYDGISICRETFLCKIGNWDNGEFIKDEFREDGRFGEKTEVASDVIETSDHSSESSCPSSGEAFVSANAGSSNLRGSRKSEKKWWFRKLRSLSCAMEERQRQSESSDCLLGARLQRVKVRQCSKKHKEFSALFSSQDFRAHEGSILVMKFSPDGKYLASAGEDKIVRVWKVVEDQRSNEIDIPDTDPFSLHFTLNHQMELQPLCRYKERMCKVKSWSRSSDSACVVLPPKVFRLLEKPICEFKGHHAEILDLSWSNSNCLLSSSVDKTVRFWQVGCEHCLGVFSHNSYVTCVQFNPIDDNYFISGSIDGKVRIWEISGSHVVSWSDVKEIVTAVSYHPDGQGCLVGSIAGFCRFYSISDNQLLLDGQICLRSKKKSSGKRIIGFQHFPQDSTKVMVTCADSQLRILNGMDVIGKYKGLRGGGNYLSSSFTADGKCIVSACEDSNVYMWNCEDHDHQNLSQAKKVGSCEWFPSTASLAVPWNGFQNVNVVNRSSFGLPGEGTTNAHDPPSPALFSLEQELFLDSYSPKGSQTWPEENLPSAHLGSASSMQKSEYKFLRACQSISNPNTWGLVILTAGWDGRIRSFHNYGLPVPH